MASRRRSLPERKTVKLGLFALGFAVLLAQTGHGQATTAGPLKFFKNYFVTGDYAVAGVGLDKTGTGGLVNGTVTIAAKSASNPGGVPAGSEALAAFLYWQVISPDGSDAGSLTATFNGRLLSTPEDLSPADPIPAGPLSVVGDLDGTIACPLTGGGSGNRVYAYRADVLRFLDVDDDGLTKITTPYKVELPDGGNAFQMPRAIGASLVVIYRDPSPTAPLNAIVLYDGNYTKQFSQTMAQSIAGFYDPAAVTGKLTHIVGSAQSSLSERLTFPGGYIDNGFRSAQGASWDNLTVTTASPGASSFVTSVAPRGLLPDCLTWGAIVYRTQVNDDDQDGLLNLWESSASTLLDPNGEPLPNLKAMGASPAQKDLFVEVASMKTTELLHYGPQADMLNRKAAHDHLPTYEALKKAGRAFMDQGITLHVDVGANYQSGIPTACYETPCIGLDPVHIIRTGARGGEWMNETFTTTDPVTGFPCVRGADDGPWVCQFSEYPGTVGWKIGYQLIRDLPLYADRENNTNTNDPTEAECEAAEEDGVAATRCDRVFDRNRRDMFHFILFAHAIGIPKSDCLDADGYPNFTCMEGTTSIAPDPNFHVPVTNTGVGDLIGGDGMVTLGGFNNAAGLPVGTDYMQAATLAHELGHSLGLLHGAFKQAATGLVIPEPGCKPNYLSVMNYLFQLRGLMDDSGTPHVDFSGQTLSPALDENSLPGGIGADGATGPRYRTGWYAPKANVVQRDLDRGIVRIVSASTRHCDGSPLSVPEQEDLDRDDELGGMVRVDSPSVAVTGNFLDWNYAAGQGTQDINFDGQLNHSGGSLNGFNDRENIRLNQVASRRNVGAWYWVRSVTNPAFYYAFMGPLSAGVTAGDLGKGGLGKGGLGKGGLGKGGLGKGGLGAGDLNLGDLGAPNGLGKGGLGKGGLGKGGLGKGGLGLPGNLGKGGLGKGGLGKGGLGEGVGEGQEMTKNIAADSGFSPPSELKAFVRATDGVGPTNSSAPTGEVWKPEMTDCATLGRGLCHRIRVDWKTPASGKADLGYRVVREVAGGGLAQEISGYTEPVVDSGQFLLFDNEELPNLSPVTYEVIASFFHEGKTITSTASATITAVNVAPVAVNDGGYSMFEDAVLNVTVPADRVLANDTDDDSPATSLRAVVQSPPSHGALVLDENGSFTYEPLPNFNGQDSFTYVAYDACGLAAKCSDDSIPATVTITINPVNDAPAGTNGTVTTLEDTAYPFTAADFGFTDPQDENMPFANGQLKVKVTAATKGVLRLSGAALPADGLVALTELTAGNLKFLPVANENGLSYATFTFQVQDDGGTLNGGKDLDTSANTMTINVTPVNDAPAGTNGTVTALEDTEYGLRVVDFGFTDPIDAGRPVANAFNRVKITTLPAKGVLKLGGAAVPAGSFISVADLTSGNLKFTAALNANGSAYTTFTFQVEDDGGTANFGVNLDQSANTITINVTPVNDAPDGMDKTFTTTKNDSHSIRAADFGFTDPNDTPANAFSYVKITTVPASSIGTLKLNGAAVAVGSLIPRSSLDGCKLVFVPKSNTTGTALITFQVQDNGGTANSGIDLDPTPNTMTIKVISGSHNHSDHGDHHHW